MTNLKLLADTAIINMNITVITLLGMVNMIILYFYCCTGVSTTMYTKSSNSFLHASLFIQGTKCY